ncbi:hypothetical protein CWIS_09780 [Cellulomonas sp. A375-1]|uniref:hypothetical protein n=1 Tax=Cellulomonas sp. A375-1 TaxID=1672219 RepID=UPI00065280F1|nr:hypothetical protein [Cellulomonas sp. A375-1]KMM45619.1 hypothetical protein CWIS_09780 [Cellulomonas sp. A375-1]
MSALDSTPQPDAIDALVAAGHAYWDTDGTLVGIAADGVHVSLNYGDRAVALRYLAEYPTPDTW